MNVEEGYRYSNSNIEMDSMDYSELLNAWMNGEDLFLKVDGLLHPPIGKDPLFYVYDCLLIVRKAKLISEKCNEYLMTPERLQEMQQFAKKENKELYIPFDAFLQNASMDVQSFEYDVQRHEFSIVGYPDLNDPADYIWCGLCFQYETIECYWNEISMI